MKSNLTSLPSYTHTDSKRVVNQDFKASTLLICIVIHVKDFENRSPFDKRVALAPSAFHTKPEIQEINQQFVGFVELNSSLTIRIIFPAIFKSISPRSRSKIKRSLQDTLSTVGRHFVFHEDWRELIQAWKLGTVFFHHLGYPSEKTHKLSQNPLKASFFPERTGK